MNPVQARQRLALSLRPMLGGGTNAFHRNDSARVDWTKVDVDPMRKPVCGTSRITWEGDSNTDTRVASA